MFKQIVELFCDRVFKFNPWEIQRNILEFKTILQKKYINENYLYNVVIEGQPFVFSDSLFSNTVKIVTAEIENYHFPKIEFKKDDCVIDIGANVGMVSIYLAKKYPFLKIYAFEPVKQNYENLCKNIKLNGIPKGKIIVENKAVTADGRPVNMEINPSNLGNSKINVESNKTYDFACLQVQSITLADIFRKYKINKCKLLKIDCEGAEYEILKNAGESLKKCLSIRGEFHVFKAHGKTLKAAKELLNYVKKFIPDVEVTFLKG